MRFNLILLHENVSHLINIWQMFNVATDDSAVKLYIPQKSLLQWICCKCLQKRSAFILRKINETVFSFEHQRFRVRVNLNHTFTHNQCNQTQLHKVNDFDFCFVSKCLHISNSRLNFIQSNLMYRLCSFYIQTILVLIAYLVQPSCNTTSKPESFVKSC